MNIKKSKEGPDPKYSIENYNNDKIIMISFPMNIVYKNKNNIIVLKIYLIKGLPLFPPKIFLDFKPNVKINPLNKNVDSKTGEIQTLMLKNWYENIKIENIINEISNSFSQNFPFLQENPSKNEPDKVKNNNGSGGVKDKAKALDALFMKKTIENIENKEKEDKIKNNKLKDSFDKEKSIMKKDEEKANIIKDKKKPQDLLEKEKNKNSKDDSNTAKKNEKKTIEDFEINEITKK